MHRCPPRSSSLRARQRVAGGADAPRRWYVPPRSNRRPRRPPPSPPLRPRRRSAAGTAYARRDRRRRARLPPPRPCATGDEPTAYKRRRCRPPPSTQTPARCRQPPASQPPAPAAALPKLPVRRWRGPAPPPNVSGPNDHELAMSGTNAWALRFSSPSRPCWRLIRLPPWPVGGAASLSLIQINHSIWFWARRRYVLHMIYFLQDRITILIISVNWYKVDRA